MSVSFTLEMNGVLGNADLLGGAPDLFEYFLGLGNELLTLLLQLRFNLFNVRYLFPSFSFEPPEVSALTHRIGDDWRDLVESAIVLIAYSVEEAISGQGRFLRVSFQRKILDL